MNRKEEIRKELEMISPFLAELELKPAFKIPKGYFDELPDTILESVSPLAELKKEQSFKVPANYFESLPDLILDRVKPQPESETVSEPASSSQSSWLDDLINSVAVLFQPRYALRLAMAVVLLVGGFFFVQNFNDTDETIASVDKDPFEEIGISKEDLGEDLAFFLSGENLESNEAQYVDEELLNELIEGLDEISDEDLKGFM